MSSMELLKTFVESEFKDFIAIPTLADASKYNLLTILSNTADSKWYYFLPKRRGKKAELTNVGPLSFITKTAMDVETLINKAEEERICILDPTYCLTKANLKLDDDDQSSHNSMLRLGEITKKSLSYEQIAEMLTKLTYFTEDFIKLGRKTHLYIIYEVLYAEKLEGLQSITTKSPTTDIGIVSCKPTFNSPGQKTLASGNGEGFSVEKEILHGKSLWRPEELGPFPIAFKCGEIRLIYKGGKKSFRLTTMDKFYKPFDATDRHYHIPTCKDPTCFYMESF